MFRQETLLMPLVTLTPDHVQPEQDPSPHRMWTLVADDKTDPITFWTVRSVIGTPVVGIPVYLS